jgi:intermediate filament protein if
MQDLNERFASYIEKVRFLEAQNKRLADELDKLKSKWGKETTQIKAIYQAELDEARKLLDDAIKEKARLEIRVASLEEQLQELSERYEDAKRDVLESREKIEQQNQQLSDLEAEVNLLRRRVENNDSDRAKDKKLIAQLQEALNRARTDLDNETLLHIDAENRRQTLEEELEFLKTLHEQEMKELAALAYRDTTSENREFWKNEMGQAMREIQTIYDEKLDVMRGELESYYNLKVQEFRTGATKQNLESVHVKEETKRLRTQLGDLRDKLNDLEAKNGQLQRELNSLRREKEERERELEDENNELKGEVSKLRAEMEGILIELQNIMDTKLGLELEIAAYRKLLEGEESRVSFRSAVDSWSNSFSGDSEKLSSFQEAALSAAPVKGEMSAKTTYQKSAKGPVSIPECGSDGKYISLENTGRKEEDLGDWVIKRTVDGQDKQKFKFQSDLIIKPGQRIKVWAKGQRPSNAPETDLESQESSWGVGADISTKLLNPAGDDRASHIQKTVYI